MGAARPRSGDRGRGGKPEDSPVTEAAKAAEGAQAWRPGPLDTPRPFAGSRHGRSARAPSARFSPALRHRLARREALAPTWRELLYVYRRMEARGEIRGGRFVSGFAGEQFALSEAVDIARAVRRAPSNGHVIQLSAVDPLNLTGFVTPGPRLPSVLGHV